MKVRIGRPLKKTHAKNIAADIKAYITSNHEFYTTRVPEMQVLAKRLHEEYSLSAFYKVFTRLWKSSYPEEGYLAVYTLYLYHEEFSAETWKHVRPKLKNIKSWDQADSVGTHLVGEILLRVPAIEKDVEKLAKSKNQWHRRIALMSTLSCVNAGKNTFALHLCQKLYTDPERQIQKAVGVVLRTISVKDKENAKRFILKHQLSDVTFDEATKHLQQLHRVRRVKKLDRRGMFFGRLR